MYGSHHPQAYVDRLYWKRSDGGRGLQSVEECIEIEETCLAYYVGQKEETLLKEVEKDELIEFKGDPKEKNKEFTRNRKVNYH